MKIIIALAFVGIIAALASAGIYMLRSGQDDGDSRRGRMARALAVRVGVSIALFVFILVAWRLGWIQPTGVPIAR